MVWLSKINFHQSRVLCISAGKLLDAATGHDGRAIHDLAIGIAGELGLGISAAAYSRTKNFACLGWRSQRRSALISPFDGRRHRCRLCRRSSRPALRCRLCAGIHPFGGEGKVQAAGREKNNHVYFSVGDTTYSKLQGWLQIEGPNPRT